LFDGELIEGHVGVEGTDDPVAIWPDGAAAVFFVAVGVGVAGEVEPFAGPAFAVLRGGEETVDGGLVVLAAGFDEGGGFFGGRGQTDEVEGDPAEERGGVSGRGRGEPFGF
jgi:hypothetical protein